MKLVDDTEVGHDKYIRTGSCLIASDKQQSDLCTSYEYHCRSRNYNRFTWDTTSSSERCCSESSLDALTIIRSLEVSTFKWIKPSNLLKSPSIDWSRWLSTAASFSFLVLLSKSFAISVACKLSLTEMLFLGVGKRITGGNTMPTKKIKNRKNVCLTVPKEANISAIVDRFPLRVPKSCENPAIPMVSSLARQMWNNKQIGQGSGTYETWFILGKSKRPTLNQFLIQSIELSPVLHVDDDPVIHIRLQKKIPCLFDFVCWIEEDGSYISDCSIAEGRTQGLSLSVWKSTLTWTKETIFACEFTSCGSRLQPKSIPFQPFVHSTTDSFHSGR